MFNEVTGRQYIPGIGNLGLLHRILTTTQYNKFTWIFILIWTFSVIYKQKNFKWYTPQKEGHTNGSLHLNSMLTTWIHYEKEQFSWVGETVASPS